MQPEMGKLPCPLLEKQNGLQRFPLLANSQPGK